MNKPISMKDEWYKSRIIWRAKQHSILDCIYENQADIPTERLVAISSKFGHELHPVILFWDSKDCWTCVSSKYVCSCYEEKLIKCDLDLIDRRLKISRTYREKIENEEVSKEDAGFILLESVGYFVWAPPGAPLFALISILKMFPLRTLDTRSS